MPLPILPLIVAAGELEAHLGARELVVVDVGERPSRLACHVPGAVHLAYASIVMARPPAQGLMPEEGRLAEALSSLGIAPESHVVAYDGQGNTRACRLLWTLDVLGHGNFSLLDGGLQAWLDGGFPIEDGLEQPRRGAYPIASRRDVAADKETILAHLGEPGVVLLDARSPAEFAGLDVRALRGGHIPGAVNMDWSRTLDPSRGTCLKPEDELRGMLDALGLSADKEVIAYCQSHHRSSHSYIVLKSLGYPRIKGYAGSWSEWGNDPELPIET